MGFSLHMGRAGLTLEEYYCTVYFDRILQSHVVMPLSLLDRTTPLHLSINRGRSTEQNKTKNKGLDTTEGMKRAVLQLFSVQCVFVLSVPNLS